MSGFQAHSPMFIFVDGDSQIKRTPMLDFEAHECRSVSGANVAVFQSSYRRPEKLHLMKRPQWLQMWSRTHLRSLIIFFVSADVYTAFLERLM